MTQAYSVAAINMMHIPKYKAFTIIELLTTMVILAIITSLVVTDFSTARRTARDSRRRDDVQTILNAMNQYYANNGTSLIENTDPKTKAKIACGVPSNTDPTQIVSPSAGCVGALGRSYGKVSLEGSNINQVITTGYGSAATYQHAGRAYATGSVADGLVNGGYLNAVPRDPLSDNASKTDPNERDYVLIRACRNGGKQAIGTNGSLFSVWASLENAPSAAELDVASKLPGGSAVVPNGADGSVYQYDFAAMQSEFDTGFYSTYGYAVGNGGASAFTDSQDCAGDPITGAGA